MSFRKAYAVKPGDRVELSTIDASDAGTWDKAKAEARLAENLEEMATLHDLLWAARRHALLVVLQGLDTSGKDGTIRHVMSGLNPQGCRVKAFKVPSEEERDHDYLWRVHAAVPPRGEVGVFNRSHYEDVLVPRVSGALTAKQARRRCEQINGFERYLGECSIIVLKIFLHISRAEQRDRLRARLEDPRKNWKLTEDDLLVRKQWHAYQRAYEDLLGACSTEHAPWHIVPADKKWYRNLVVSELVVEQLRKLRMKWPEPHLDLAAVHVPK